MSGGEWEEDRLTGRWEIFRDAPNFGWVDWHGGPPPFATGDVDVRLRSGRLIFYRGVADIGGRKNPGGNWIHLGERTDIIAYRPHSQPVYPGDPNEVIPF
jgi:hypothetical protein